MPQLSKTEKISSRDINNLIELLRKSEDPKIRSQTADNLQRISIGHPELLSPLETRIEILDIYTVEGQADVRRQLIKILPLLGYCQMALPGITDRLLDDVKFHPDNRVRLAAMQSLYDISKHEKQFRDKVGAAIDIGANGSKSMQARARKLSKALS